MQCTRLHRDMSRKYSGKPSHLIVLFQPTFFLASCQPFVYSVHDFFSYHRFVVCFHNLCLNICQKFRRIHKTWMLKIVRNWANMCHNILCTADSCRAIDIPESTNAMDFSGAVLISSSMCAFLHISSSSYLLLRTSSFILLDFSFVNLATSASVCQSNNDDLTRCLQVKNKGLPLPNLLDCLK